MARINLLPWREVERKEKQKEFLTMVGLVSFLMLVIVFYAHIHVGKMIDAQNGRNSFLEDQTKVLDRKIDEIKKLEEDKKKLLARMNVIQDLQRSRPGIVHMYDELVATIPEGIYFTQMTRMKNVVTIEGRAQSNARVSNFMRNLDASPWFDKPRLIVIDSATTSNETGSRFTLEVDQVDVIAQEEEASS